MTGVAFDGLGPEKQRRPIRPWVRVVGTLGLVAATVLAGWGGVYFQGAELLPLRTIRIEGPIRNLQPADLQRAVAAHLGTGFFRVDAKAVQDAAMALPWVRKVTVRRVWPDVLLLWVEEQIPFARWGADGLVTAEGVVFRPRQAEIPSDLPLLSGDDGESAEVTEDFRKIQAKVDSLGLKVIRLEINRRGAWTVGFGNGPDLALGAQQQEERLARFLRVFPVLRAQGQLNAEHRSLASVDMRYSNGVAVSWRTDAMQGGAT